MTDLSAYGEKDPEKDKAPVRGDFADPTETVYLTKSSHQDQEKHKIGDSLPESILAYSEGSASLPADPAGNQPTMLRSRTTVLGNGATYAVPADGAWHQLFGFTISVACPSLAGAGAHVKTSLQLGDVRPIFLGGVTQTFVQICIHRDGLQMNGAQALVWVDANPGDYPTHPGAVPVAIPAVIVPWDVNINPGTTINFQVMAITNSTATPKYRYDIVGAADRAFFKTELYY